MISLISYIKRNVIIAGISAILLLIVISAALSWFNKQEMMRNAVLKEQALSIKENTRLIIRSVVQRLDISVRGYGVTKEDKLLMPLNLAKRDFNIIFHNLDSLFAIPGHQQFAAGAQDIKKAVGEYINWTEQMVNTARLDSMDTFVEMMKLDKGTALWYVYDPFAQAVFKYEDEFIANAQADYDRAVNRNVIVQIVLLILAAPTFISILVRLKKDKQARKKLLQVLLDNNQKYLFNKGEQNNSKAEEQVVNDSITNFVKISDFVNKISSGDYAVQWEGLNETNASLNENTVAGNLVKMKERLLSMRSEDEKRNWTNEGLTQFSAILRSDFETLHQLCDKVIVYLCKYLNVQQGSLYVQNDQVLVLMSCYAFQRKKHIEQRIDIGSGLVGQAYMEKETMLLTEVPQNYLRITSGLGDASPACLVIVPLKQNGQVEGVAEFASFRKMTPTEVQFLEKCGEFLASALISARTTAQMQKLLQQSQQQTEMMRSQEEEMRQNMEELQATQEEMHRKKLETDRQIDLLHQQLREKTSVN